MGWGSILGDFAKGFAEGYIEERGVKGTIKDIGDIASGLFNDSDSEEEADDNDWNQLFSTIEKLNREEKYIESLNTLDSFYNEYMDGDGDSTYFYCRAETLVEYLESEIGSDDFDDILDELNTALREGKSFKDKDFKKEFEEIEHQRAVAINSHQEVVEWKKLKENCLDLCRKAKFDKAEELVEDWYNRYDMDSGCPYLYALINIERHKQDLFSGKSPAKEEINATEHFISEVARDATAVEWCKELNDALKAVKVRCAAIKPVAPRKETKQEAGVTSLSDSEKEYLDEIKACLEDDGEISARERRLLDKLCLSLGISAERAAELEAIATGTPALTDSEKEYFSELKECMSDGIISDRERRLLNRIRQSLNITEERAAFIESILKTK